jgi:long-chain acyl-CoA synthetase
MSKLQAEATGLKGHLVSALLSASYTHIQTRRVLQGTSLLHALQPPSAAQRLLAAVSLAVTAPLYALAQKLVFSKVCGCAGVC